VGILGKVDGMGKGGGMWVPDNNIPNRHSWSSVSHLEAPRSGPRRAPGGPPEGHFRKEVGHE
jgi:hypothetical protein